MIFQLSPQDEIQVFREYLQSIGFVPAALLFLVVFVLCSALPVPASAFMISAGILFGFPRGIILSMSGFMVGAVSGFLLSRYLLREQVQRYLPARVQTTIGRVHQHGWQLVAILRMVGLVPAPFVNYAMGITNIKLFDFIWPTFVFSLPIGTLMVYAGSAGREFIESGNLERLILMMTFVALLFAVIYAIRLRIRARLPKVPDEDKLP